MIQLLDDGTGLSCSMMGADSGDYWRKLSYLMMRASIQVLNREASGGGWRGSTTWVLWGEGCTWPCRCPGPRCSQPGPGHQPLGSHQRWLLKLKFNLAPCGLNQNKTNSHVDRIKIYCNLNPMLLEFKFNSFLLKLLYCIAKYTVWHCKYVIGTVFK